MSEHPKLPDIVEALEWLNYRIAIDDPAWRHLRALRAEIERLRSPAPAADGEGLREALMDSQYLAGAKAGWNAAQADDPNAAYEAICRGRAGYLAAISRPSARPSIPAEDGEGLREALVRIEIITASGRTDELLGKMKTINSLAHSALSNSISQGEK